MLNFVPSVWANPVLVGAETADVDLVLADAALVLVLSVVGAMLVEELAFVVALDA